LALRSVMLLTLRSLSLSLKFDRQVVPIGEGVPKSGLLW
jgi:hypothetical protein